jgi:hypothetical protein
VRHRVGDQPRRAVNDLLHNLQVVLAQRVARGGEVDDAVHEARERGQLHGPLDLHDLGLPAGVGEVLLGDARVLGGQTDPPEPPQRLAEGVVALAPRHDHLAVAEAEVQQLVDLAIRLLEEHVLARYPDVGRAVLDVGGHVAGPHGHDAGLLEQQLALVGADLGRVEADAVEEVEGAAEQRAPWHGHC